MCQRGAGVESALASLISSRIIYGNLILNVAMLALAHLHIIPVTPIFLLHTLDKLGHVSYHPFPIVPFSWVFWGLDVVSSGSLATPDMNLVI